MKPLLVAAILAAPVVAHASTGLATPSIEAQLRCTWLTLQQAARGDFSQWVLPDFVPWPHLRAGELPDCLRIHGQTGFPRPLSSGPQAGSPPVGNRR